MATFTIREETDADAPAIREVHQIAFDQDFEPDLVEALRRGGYTRISLVAEREGVIVGHVLFSEMVIVSKTDEIPALSLAPVAVLPEHQRQGIGSALIRKGLEIARERGERIAIVLGHADFYPKFGFSANAAEPLSSPFSGHAEWMAIELAPGALRDVQGWVRYPPPFGVPPTESQA